MSIANDQCAQVRKFRGEQYGKVMNVTVRVRFDQGQMANAVEVVLHAGNMSALR